MNGRIEAAIEELIDRYMSDYDFGEMENEIAKAVTEEVQSELDEIDEMKNRIASIEEKLAKIYEALR